MGGADYINVLYSEFLNFDPDDAEWVNRDRFFLDPGHMSPMLYATLSLIGKYSMEDLKNFRQWGSITPGHPEVDVKRGVENTSGPLGQGHAMAVGAAIAERFLVARFGEWMAHKTYAFISDGGIQEEISQGAGRIAGTLGLANLIMFYDSNNIQLSTKVDEVTHEDTAKKYEAWGWQVITIDGNDAAEIRQALKVAQEEKERPTLIIGHTLMGKGAVGANEEDFSNKVSTHGQPLSAAGASFENTVANLGGDPQNPFVIFPDVQEYYAQVLEEKRAQAKQKKAEQAAWEKANPELAAKFHRFMSGEAPAIDYKAIAHKANIATRQASADVLVTLAQEVENMIVSSADLSNSDKTDGFIKGGARSARAAGELFRAALADCPGDREQELADAEEKKTPSAREKAKNAVLEKYTDAQERLDKAAALLGRVEQLAVAGEWTPLYDLLTPYVLGMEELPGLKGMKKRLNGEHKKVIRTRADEGAALFAQILEQIPCSEEEAEADRRAAEPRLRALFAAVRDFDARFSAKKRDRKLLEFSDFEHQALRLLRDPDGTPTALCGVIRQNYAAVMVDEYQDTNALQDALYRCLASPAGDDLFLVGDLKQSIYRFRQADPSIFREKLDSWPALPGGAARPRPAEGAPGTDAMLALDANFRSAPQVVEGVNFLFERLMSPELGDTAYGDGQRLVCGAPGEYTGSVEAHFLPDDTAETDADWIARRIEEMVQSGEPVRDGSATRPVQYEDCCILLAARNDFPAYVEELTFVLTEKADA